MQSTGVLNLSIGITGVKEIREAHLSYMCLARAAASLPSLFRPIPPDSAAAVSHPRSLRHRATPLQRRPYTTAASAARAPPPPSASVPPPLPLRATTHAAALHTAAALAQCSQTVRRFARVEMGREKRKGKEVLVEKPVRKRTRAEREAERAEMVDKAAEEQASGRARPFAIREQPAWGRGRGRGMGRVRGARVTRATTQ